MSLHAVDPGGVSRGPGLAQRLGPRLGVAVWSGTVRATAWGASRAGCGGPGGTQKVRRGGAWRQAEAPEVAFSPTRDRWTAYMSVKERGLRRRVVVQRVVVGRGLAE
jgi:hypothetical protein